MLLPITVPLLEARAFKYERISMTVLGVHMIAEEK
jgi:hypothetical protein